MLDETLARNLHAMNRQVAVDHEESWFSNNHVEADLDEQYHLCNCGARAVVKTCMTPENPGRQFYRCGWFEEETENCGYFKWKDERTPAHLQKLLVECVKGKEWYKARYYKVRDEKAGLLCQLTDLEDHCQKIGDELVEKRKSVVQLTEELKMAKEHDGRLKTQHIWFAVTLGVILWSMYAGH